MRLLNAEGSKSGIDKNIPFTSTNQTFVDKLVLEPDPRDSYIHPLYIRSPLSEYRINIHMNIQNVIETIMHEMKCQKLPSLPKLKITLLRNLGSKATKLPWHNFHACIY